MECILASFGSLMEILCVDNLNICDTVILSQMVHLLHFPLLAAFTALPPLIYLPIREIRTFQITPPRIFAQPPKALIRILHV